MFSRVPQPLAFAEALLAQFGALSRETDITALLGGFARAVGELSGCELSQLYLLDQTHTALTLNAECRDGLLQALEPSSLPADYTGEQLLQFALCQNRVVSLVDLPSRLHETGFLPAGEQPWLSLLCVPLVSPEKTVEGMVVCATRRPLDLQGFAHPLGQLGSFVLAQLHLLQRLSQPSGEPQGPSSAPVVSGYGLIGRSAAMRETCRLISKVLHNPYTVLLQGETGTGKELLARACHLASPRGQSPFMALNCAGLPESMAETELFGYGPGAFEGARPEGKLGLLELTAGGTLFLDGVGEMSPRLQAKLLRFLQDGCFRRVGSDEEVYLDVRVICATQVDLSELCAKGEFRQDLYHRLNVLSLHIPPLRECLDGLAPLAEHFLDQASRQIGCGLPKLSAQALERLERYHWPGNVRQLENVLFQAVSLCEGGTVKAEHIRLPDYGAPQPLGDFSLEGDLDAIVGRFEKAVLERLFREHPSSRQLGKRLGVSHTTAANKLRQHGVGQGEG